MHSKKKDTPKTRKKLIAGIILCCVFVLCHIWQKPLIVPRELIGTWKTTDPRYADRYLEIDGHTIDFYTGKGTGTTGFIQKIDAVSQGSRTLYTIFYVQDGQDEQCSFYVALERQDTIYLQNQPGIAWTKDNDS
jgi:hypothetical protein